MKLKLFYVILLLCFCCDETSKKQSIKTSIGDLTNKKPSVFLEECIFDQATQTDEFLKQIDELEGYVWNPETKTAEIALDDHRLLTIKRGGCNHFEMSASFKYDRILNIEKDEKQIFDNIIWITSLLKDFDGKDIKRVIEEGKVDITKRDNFNYYANFMDKKLYEHYYFNFNNETTTTFDIGYYYN